MLLIYNLIFRSDTLSTCYKAIDLGLKVIPVINKIDLPQSDPEQVKKKIEEENLLRELKHGTQETGANFHFNGHKLINFCSNNYLGLCSHERIKTAAKEAVDSYGVGSGASRLVSGSSLPHLEVENESAIFFEKE